MQVADGQPDDRSFVQLACDGPGQWQHLGQLKELEVLLPPPRTSRIARFLFTQVLETEMWTRSRYEDERDKGESGAEGERQK